MIYIKQYTLREYAELFLVQNKNVSAKTIERRALKGLLPSGCKLIKKSGKTGARMIEVMEESL